MRNLFKTIGVVLVMGAWLHLSTPAMAQSYIRRYSVHVAAAPATTVVTAAQAYIATVVITVATVGTNPIQITDTAGNVKFQAASTALGTIVNFTQASKDGAASMLGIKLVAPATAVFDVFINYYIN